MDATIQNGNRVTIPGNVRNGPPVVGRPERLRGWHPGDMAGRARAAISGLLAGAGAVAVAAALLTGAGAPPAEEPAQSPVAAAAGGPVAEPARATDPSGHGSWTLGDPTERVAMLPAGLRTDLSALRTVPAAGRLAALAQIRDDALAGGYGPEVRSGTERLVAGLALLPPEVVADLEGLVSSEVAAMPDVVERIRDAALSGRYGDQVRLGVQRLVATAAQHGIDVTGDLDRYLPASTD